MGNKMKNIFQRIQGLEPAKYSQLFAVLSSFVGLIHVVLLGLFWYEKVFSLVRLNIISIFLYILCVYLSRKKKIRLVYHMIISETFLFSAIVTGVIGGEYLFNMYCLATIPFTFLTYYVLETSEEQQKTFHPFFYCILATCLFFLEQCMVWVGTPGVVWVESTGILRFLQVFNMLVNISCSLIGGLSLSTVALENIKIVRRNMTQIEELMHAAEESNRAKSTFLANMSHEIRTPMNAICGMTDMLLDEEMSEQGKECTLSIKSASNSLLSIINDILDFSKLESGKMVIMQEEYYIASVIHDLMNMMQIRIKEKPLVLQANVQDSIPKKLCGDSGRIRQILINIMGNATKFTQEGKITLTVSWQAIDEKQGRLKFSVTDTGIGIKKEDIGKLFNTFEQVDLKKNKGIEGTGLGLSICKLLVEQMGGKIWVESEYGKGSTFHFFVNQIILDATPCDYSKNLQKTEVKQFEISFLAPEAKVMVVDDMKINLRVAAGILKKFGIVPDLVDNGIDAVEILKKKKDYDLIFMDHMMPEVDGIEATGMIRAIGEEYTDKLPIIALSANAVKGMDAEFRAGGMNDFVPKPIEVEFLAEKLLQWLPEEKIEHRAEKPQS